MSLAEAQEAHAQPEAKEEPQGLGTATWHAAAQAAIGTPGKILSGVGRELHAATSRMNAEQMPVLDRIDRGEFVPPSRDPVGYGDMNPEQRKAYRAQLAKPEPSVEESPLVRTGEGIQKYGREHFPVAPEQADRFLPKMAGVVGGIVPYVGAAMLPGGLPATMIASYFDGAGEARKQAEAAGATPEQADEAAHKTGLVNAGAMGLPVANLLKPFIPLVRNPGALGLAKSAATKAAENGVVFEGVGQAQQYLNNAVAQGTYDPNRRALEGIYDPTKGIGENIAEHAPGMAAGALLGAAHAPLLPKGPKPPDAPGVLKNIAEGKPPETPRADEPEPAPTAPPPAPPGAPPPSAPSAAAAEPPPARPGRSGKVGAALDAIFDGQGRPHVPEEEPPPVPDRELPPVPVEEPPPETRAPATAEAPIAATPEPEPPRVEAEVRAEPAAEPPPPTVPADTIHGGTIGQLRRAMADADIKPGRVTFEGSGETRFATVRDQTAEEAQRFADAMEKQREISASKSAGAKKRQNFERPIDINQFIASQGGIKDTGGELRSQDMHLWSNPNFGGRLVRDTGMEQDHARELAQEAGYRPPDDPDSPSQVGINDLLDAMIDTHRGDPRFSTKDKEKVDEWQRQRAEMQRDHERVDADLTRLEAVVEKQEAQPVPTRDDIMRAWAEQDALDDSNWHWDYAIEPGHQPEQTAAHGTPEVPVQPGDQRSDVPPGGGDSGGPERGPGPEADRPADAAQPGPEGAADRPVQEGPRPGVEPEPPPERLSLDDANELHTPAPGSDAAVERDDRAVAEAEKRAQEEGVPPIVAAGEAQGIEHIAQPETPAEKALATPTGEAPLPDDAAPFPPPNTAERVEEALSPADTLARFGLVIERKTANKSGNVYWAVSGRTLDHKGALDKAGFGKPFKMGRTWYRSVKGEADPSPRLAAVLKGEGDGALPRDDTKPGVRGASEDDSGAVRGADEDARVSDARRREDSRPDERGALRDASDAVSAETRALIERGLDFNIPREVVDDQIQDVGLIKAAHRADKKAFLLANEAGTGKTFVVGGAIREMRDDGATGFVYFTMNQDLIEQIKRDLKTYGVDDIEFHTYSELSGGGAAQIPTAGKVVIFDEAHNVKNVSGTAARGTSGQKLMADAKFTVFASATPFENPVQAQYLAGTGVFDRAGGFVDWAKAYSAAVRKTKVRNPETGRKEIQEDVYWPGRGKQQDGAAARQWFFRQGVMTQRQMRIDPDMVDVSFNRTKVDERYVDMYDNINKAYDKALQAYLDADGNSRNPKITSEIARHRENLIKRVLEASKIPFVIERAQTHLAAGKSVVVFVETKADREVGRWKKSSFFKDDTTYDYPGMERLMSSWEAEVAAAYRMRERPPPRPFAEFIFELARHFHDAEIRHDLPSTSDQISAALGGPDNVGIYTGAVTNAAARRDKEAFLAGQKKVLVATMAKGGTGLSLHDTVGNRPTVQLGLNLPWTASAVDQVSGRIARYGLMSKAEIEWLFANNIPWETDKLAPRVAGRMSDMGAVVKGMDVKAVRALDELGGIEGTHDVSQAHGEGVIDVSAQADGEPDLEDPYVQAERLERSRTKAEDTSGGFFATPYPLGVLMGKIAGISSGDQVLEPSAGTGNLVRFLPEGAKVTAVERRRDNFQILEKLMGPRNAALFNSDFLEWSENNPGKFDVVLMNPPFERLAGIGPQDVAHVRRAYDMLAPDGRMVAILGEGAFFRQSKPETAFREWLEEVGATVIKLPENAFKQSGTGVRARMIVVDKHEDAIGGSLDLRDLSLDSLREIEGMIPRPNATAFQTAWHGSPHDFDRFSTEAIGEGEGHQTYGHGLYFAGRKDIARHYQETFANQVSRDDVAAHLPAGAPESLVTDLYRHIKTTEPRKRELLAGKGVSEAYNRNRDAREFIDQNRAAIEKAFATKIEKPARLYKVDLAPAEHEWLDHDKPLDQQSDHVKQALARIPDRVWEAIREDAENHGQNAPEGPHDGDYTGGQLYKYLTRAAREDILPVEADYQSEKEGASNYLQELGIPGIRYLDAGSRSLADAAGSASILRMGVREQEKAVAMRREHFEKSQARINEPGWTPMHLHFAERDKGYLEHATRTLEDFRQRLAEAEEKAKPIHNYVVFDDKHIKIEDKFQRALKRADANGAPRGEMARLSRDLVGRVKLRDEFTKPESEIAKRVDSIAKKMFPQARVRAHEELHARGEEGGEAHGAYYTKPAGAGLAHIVAWSLRSPNPEGSVKHEGIHYLRRSGMIAPNEWKALSDAAEREGWLDKHKIEERYPNLSRGRQIEEAVAEEFGERRSDQFKGLPEPLRNIFRALDLLRRRIAGAAREIFGRNATADDVMTAVESGKVGRRTPRDEDTGTAEQRPPVTEMTDQGEQVVMPGAEHVSPEELARRKAESDRLQMEMRMKGKARSKSGKAQRDEGALPLFGSKGEQASLFDEPEPAKPAATKKEPDQGSMFQRPRTAAQIEADEKASRERTAGFVGALKSPFRALMNTSPMKRLTSGEGFKKLSEATDAVKDSVIMKVSPMAAGKDHMSEFARSEAKRFINEQRWLTTQFDQLDKMVERLYSHDERMKMGDALDEQSVIDQMKAADPKFVPDADVGLARLTDDQRATVKMLDELSQRVWQHMYDAGMVRSKEGLPHYMPRLFVRIGTDGLPTKLLPPKGGAGSALDKIGTNLSTASPLGRKYMLREDTEKAAKGQLGDDVHLVRDIRALIYALHRNEQAVNGRKLVDGIREMGTRAGIQTVHEGGAPEGGNTFTIDHPALKVWRPVLRQDKTDSKQKWESAEFPSDESTAFAQFPIHINKEFEGPLRAVLNKPPSAIYKALMHLKAGVTSMIMISPAIHLSVEFGRTLPLMPGKVITTRVFFDGNRVRKMYDKAGDVIPENVERMRRWLAAGYVPIGRSWMQDISGMATEPGLLAGKSLPAKFAGMIAGMVGGPDAKMAARRAVDKAGDFWHGTLLWERIADLQAGIAENVEQKYLKEGYPPEAAAAIAAHMANRYAGALPMESMSGMARAVANLTMFSRSFTLGNLGVMKDMFNGLPKDVRAKLEREVGPLMTKAAQSTARRKAIGAFMVDVALFYGMNAALQGAFTGTSPGAVGSGLVGGTAGALTGARFAGAPGALVGGLAGGAAGALLGYDDKEDVWRFQQMLKQVREHPLDVLNPFGMIQSMTPQGQNEAGKKDRFFMGTDSEGRGEYGRATMGKIGEEYIGWWTHPLEMVRRKQSTLIGPLREAVEGRDAFGRDLYDKDDPTMTGSFKAAGAIVGHWLAAQVPMREAQGVYRWATGEPQGGQELKKALVPFVTGMTISSGHPLGPVAGEEQRFRDNNKQQILRQAGDINRTILRGVSRNDETEIDHAYAAITKLGLSPKEAGAWIRNTADKSRKAHNVDKWFQRHADADAQERVAHTTH